MEFEEMLIELKKGSNMTKERWKGDGLIIYIRVQNPDENSLNTEPYIMMINGIYCSKEGFEAGINYSDVDEKGGWVFKRFPWIPSSRDFFDVDWELADRDKMRNIGD